MLPDDEYFIEPTTYLVCDYGPTPSIDVEDFDYSFTID
jgi:hypothetical protein